MSRIFQRGFLVALLAAASVNLAAGARRPPVERAILGRDHYAHAEQAVAAVERMVPAGAPLAVVVYDGDMLDELDAAIWFDYRSKSQLYPRRIDVFRVSPDSPLELRPVPGEPPPRYAAAPYPAYAHVLFFRASAAPVLPAIPLQRLASDPMWVLARNQSPGRSR